MYKLKLFKIIVACCIAGIAYAHVSDGKMDIYDGINGAYEISVISQSGVPVVGEQHFNIVVRHAADQQAIPDAVLTLEIRSPQELTTIYSLESGEQPFLFSVDLPMEQMGKWHMKLSLQSSLGNEDAVFDLRLFTPLMVWLIPIGIFLGAALFMGYLGFGNFDLSVFRKKSKEVKQATVLMK